MIHRIRILHFDRTNQILMINDRSEKNGSGVSWDSNPGPLAFTAEAGKTRSENHTTRPHTQRMEDGC